MIRLGPTSNAHHDALRANFSRLSRLFTGYAPESAVAEADSLFQTMKAQMAELRFSLRAELGEAKKRQRADAATCAGLKLVGAAGLRAGRGR